MSRRVVEYVAAHPGLSSHEIASGLGHDKVWVIQSELAVAFKLGRVERVGGHLSRRYYPPGGAPKIGLVACDDVKVEVAIPPARFDAQLRSVEVEVSHAGGHLRYVEVTGQIKRRT